MKIHYYINISYDMRLDGQQRQIPVQHYYLSLSDLLIWTPCSSNIPKYSLREIVPEPSLSTFQTNQGCGHFFRRETPDILYGRFPPEFAFVSDPLISLLLVPPPCQDETVEVFGRLSINIAFFNCLLVRTSQWQIGLNLVSHESLSGLDTEPSLVSGQNWAGGRKTNNWDGITSHHTSQYTT